MGRMSDFLYGTAGGAGAGASTAGGLAAAGLVGGPAAWGIIGGTALLGGLGSMMEDDDPMEKMGLEMAGLKKEGIEIQNQMLMDQTRAQREEQRRNNAIKRHWSNSMNSFWRGAKIPSPSMKLHGVI
jgi:hypothetical protein